MRRRDCLVLLGGGLISPAFAQVQRLRRLGVLMSQSDRDQLAQERLAVFRTALEAAGWVESRNIALEYRWAAADERQSGRLAAELAALAPDVILTVGTPNARAAMKEAPSIPVVFVGVTDPIGSGLVDSLARPGGQVTGFANFESSMIGKWSEILREISPKISHVAAMFNPATSPREGAIYFSAIDASRHSSGPIITTYPVKDEADIRDAISRIAGTASDGLMVLPDVFTVSKRSLIIALAKQHAVPAIYPFRFFASEGGLIYYGINGVELYRRAAGYANRILRGTRVADLPVQQPTTFELVINAKTAAALGLTIPPTLLARADEVIE